MKIVVIPDTQVKVGTSIDHIRAAGNYIVEHKPDHVVVLGDWYDMPSLSRFNTEMGRFIRKRVLRNRYETFL